jgi:hypothetical protein
VHMCCSRPYDGMHGGAQTHPQDRHTHTKHTRPTLVVPILIPRRTTHTHTNPPTGKAAATSSASSSWRVAPSKNINTRARVFRPPSDPKQDEEDEEDDDHDGGGAPPRVRARGGCA